MEVEEEVEVVGDREVEKELDEGHEEVNGGGRGGG